METQFAVHATLLLDFKEPKSTQQNSSDSSFQERNHLFPLECHVWQHHRSGFAQYISMISVDLLMCTVAVAQTRPRFMDFTIPARAHTESTANDMLSLPKSSNGKEASRSNSFNAHEVQVYFYNYYYYFIFRNYGPGLSRFNCANCVLPCWNNLTKHKQNEEKQEIKFLWLWFHKEIMHLTRSVFIHFAPNSLFFPVMSVEMSA